jgi:hypothetical protein
MRFVQGEGGKVGGDVADALAEEIACREVHASGGDTDLKTAPDRLVWRTPSSDVDP